MIKRNQAGKLSWGSILTHAAICPKDGLPALAAIVSPGVAERFDHWHHEIAHGVAKYIHNNIYMDFETADHMGHMIVEGAELGLLVSAAISTPIAINNFARDKSELYRSLTDKTGQYMQQKYEVASDTINAGWNQYTTMLQNWKS